MHSLLPQIYFVVLASTNQPFPGYNRHFKTQFHSSQLRFSHNKMYNPQINFWLGHYCNILSSHQHFFVNYMSVNTFPTQISWYFHHLLYSSLHNLDPYSINPTVTSNKLYQQDYFNSSMHAHTFLFTTFPFFFMHITFI